MLDHGLEELTCLLSFVLCGGHAGGLWKAEGKYGAVDIEATNEHELNDSAM